ncbi:hypothetical protein H4219_003125 [Mycoemilia scoparia]|uniref:Serine aminopeptidase S33 domain-containing protein n=1 Tax=Mycoemilia scoparia TaxID=417184 RepID=A0A9W8A0W8_9FUNG|nr:hypothetical protein H4219_003125 [Mycoemilia scoparia]
MADQSTKDSIDDTVTTTAQPPQQDQQPQSLPKTDSDIGEFVDYVKVNKHEFYTRRFKSAIQPPKATVLVVHGFGEFCDRYEKLCRTLAKSGFETMTFDQKGWGKTCERTKSRKGDNGGWIATLRDISAMSALLKQDSIPNFLYGHSMGGALVVNYAAVAALKETTDLDTDDDDDDAGKKKIKNNKKKTKVEDDSFQYTKVDGIISSSPGLKIGKAAYPGDLLTSILGTVSGYARWIPWSVGFEDDHLTQNQEELKKLRESPFVHGRSTIGTLYDVFKQGEHCRKNHSKDFKTPVLLIHGDGDLICDVEGTREFYNNLPSNTDKELLIIESKYHELNFEPELSESLPKKIVEWFSSRCGGPNNK